MRPEVEREIVSLRIRRTVIGRTDPLEGDTARGCFVDDALALVLVVLGDALGEQLGADLRCFLPECAFGLLLLEHELEVPRADVVGDPLVRFLVVGESSSATASSSESCLSMTLLRTSSDADATFTRSRTVFCARPVVSAISLYGMFRSNSD